MNSIKDAQQDMRNAYYSGFSGVLVSGTVWLIAGIMSLQVSPKAGIMTLIFGGMLIFSLSVVLCKIMGVSGKHKKDNPLAPLAMESTFWMIISIPIVIGVALHNVEWFFPAMMFVIGGRYLTFSTLYGLRLYWIFAAALVIAGWILLGTHAPVFSSALTGALIEYTFGFILLFSHKSAIKSGI